jgi:hypothetical protein
VQGDSCHFQKLSDNYNLTEVWLHDAQDMDLHQLTTTIWLYENRWTLLHHKINKHTSTLKTKNPWHQTNKRLPRHGKGAHLQSLVKKCVLKNGKLTFNYVVENIFFQRRSIIWNLLTSTWKSSVSAASRLMLRALVAMRSDMSCSGSCSHVQFLYISLLEYVLFVNFNIH